MSDKKRIFTRTPGAPPDTRTLDSTPGLDQRADTAALARLWPTLDNLQKVACLALFINRNQTDLHTRPALTMIRHGLAELHRLKVYLRDQGARAAGMDFPDSFPIYRGAHASERLAGLCWTRSKARAVEYAGPGGKVWTVQRVTVLELDGILHDGEETLVVDVLAHEWSPEEENIS